MVDKNLFLYDLAIVAIFKNEGHYLKEWIDYHLLAGVEHFYLYNNDSSDDYKEILAPYVEKNLVTLTEFPGKIMQCPAYEDAIDKYRFECRYMAFIDCDEFIYPKVDRGGSIIEVVDEILSDVPDAAGLAINWQCFGSNGQEKADYSRGVLERFTRRAPDDWRLGNVYGNDYPKSVSNPRRIDFVATPHTMNFFKGFYTINEVGEKFESSKVQIHTEKIVVNHYYLKSREEFNLKISRGWACPGKAPYNDERFKNCDRNEIFDDGILKYQAARAEAYSIESHEQRLSRVKKTLIDTLNQCHPADAPEEFFVGKLETFLTCRALAQKLGDDMAEEFSIIWIYWTLVKSNKKTRAEIYQLIHALPEILARPFFFCKKFKNFVQESLLPAFRDFLKNGNVMTGTKDWIERADLIYIQKLLRLIK